MTSDQFPMQEFFAFLLWFLKEDHLTANECTALVYLGCLADRDGCGHVKFASMSKRFGRVPNCCRRYLHRAKRHGVIERWKPDGEGGAAFRLFVPPVDTGRPPTNKFHARWSLTSNPPTSRRHPSALPFQ